MSPFKIHFWQKATNVSGLPRAADGPHGDIEKTGKGFVEQCRQVLREVLPVLKRRTKIRSQLEITLTPKLEILSTTNRQTRGSNTVLVIEAGSTLYQIGQGTNLEQERRIGPWTAKEAQPQGLGLKVKLKVGNFVT